MYKSLISMSVNGKLYAIGDFIEESELSAEAIKSYLIDGIIEKVEEAEKPKAEPKTAKKKTE